MHNHTANPLGRLPCGVRSNAASTLSSRIDESVQRAPHHHDARELSGDGTGRIRPLDVTRAGRALPHLQPELRHAGAPFRRRTPVEPEPQHRRRHQTRHPATDIPQRRPRHSGRPARPLRNLYPSPKAHPIDHDVADTDPQPAALAARVMRVRSLLQRASPSSGHRRHPATRAAVRTDHRTGPVRPPEHPPTRPPPRHRPRVRTCP
jgi:hypothetical protein